MDLNLGFTKIYCVTSDRVFKVLFNEIMLPKFSNTVPETQYALNKQYLMKFY